MKKLALLFIISTSILFGHECKYNLNITLNLEKGVLNGKAKITSDHNELTLLDSSAQIKSISGAKLIVKNSKATLVKEDADTPINIEFYYKFKKGSENIVLLGGWYPQIDLMCRYETFVNNKNLKVVTEATDKKSFKNGYLFKFDNPVSSINLVASKNYIASSKDSDVGIKINTYFYPEDKHLSKKYIEKSLFYFKKYKSIFGFVPFSEFSVVETPFPAGYSMPTYTLIGRQIIDKPFMLDTSLGHEIVHQWFGNYVYSPYMGNWAEGITTYYADLLYARQKNKGAKYRKELLIKYDSFVDKSNEIALIEFTSKNRESKNAIGYGKGAFFFYMLEQKIGKESFNKAIKNLLKKYPFKRVTYKDLRVVFEEASGEKLLDLFKEWVYKKGAFDFNILNKELKFVDDRYILTFDIYSNKKVSKLPIKICSTNECLWETIDLSKTNQKLELDIEPTKIVVDENYEIFRRLQPKEVPPVIYRVIEGDITLVIDRGDSKRFSKMARAFKKVVYSDEVKFDEIKNEDLLVLGKNNSFLKQIALDFKMEGDTKIELFKNPFNDTKVIAVFDSTNLSRKIFFRLRHLGKYSTVVFKNGKTVKKEIKPSQNGAVFKIKSGSYYLEPTLNPLASLFPMIVDKRVVFIGENHTNFSNHLNQLKIIDAMVKSGKKVAIGMEMFQEPFQKHLDDYIAGKITEKDMLKKSEYFKRWKYNYSLYRPIILYAKKHKLPIIALNIEREITKKVVKEGIDSLSKEEREKVPVSMDFSNDRYKEELRAIYSSHSTQNFKNFDEFYYAQLLWDETMAKNIVRYLNDNPDKSMVVIAGNGHIMYGYGIPDRVKRRGIKDYTIIVNSMKPKPGIADYLLYPEPISTIDEKKIGVYLESDNNLKVTDLVEDSPAQKSGIKKGDIIVAIDKNEVNSIPELKVELFFTSKKAIVTVLRENKRVDIPIEFKEGKNIKNISKEGLKHP